jgi:tetratricopeptide (TPR) repeat protein
MPRVKARKKSGSGKAEQLYLQGRAHHKAGDLAMAEAAYKEVLRLIPTQPDALHMLGVAAFQQDRFEEAERLLATAIRRIPKPALAYYNYGNALRKLGRIEGAIDAFTRSFELDPSNFTCLEQLGNIYKELNQFDKAYQYYDQLLAIDPNNAIGRSNKAIALLTEGKFAEGWDLYESRLDSKFDENHFMSNLIPRLAPDWDGGKLSKPLLVLPEQGLGDQIFYGGMLADLELAGIEVLVCVDERVVELFRRSFPSLMFASPRQVAALDNGNDLFGAQITMASMGRWLRRSVDDFKKIRSPFLRCEKSRSVRLRNQLKNPSRLLVGLSWQSLHAKNGPTKSCSLEQMLPLLKTEIVDFIDLQYGDTTEERGRISEAHQVEVQRLDHIDNKMDIEALAALIEACDVIVTVSNTTAHLAAAIGKPTLVLLPWHTPLWYWHSNLMDSPWYPNAILLRQAASGDWSVPVAQAAKIIKGLTIPPR